MLAAQGCILKEATLPIDSSCNTQQPVHLLVTISQVLPPPGLVATPQVHLQKLSCILHCLTLGRSCSSSALKGVVGNPAAHRQLRTGSAELECAAHHPPSRATLTPRSQVFPQAQIESVPLWLSHPSDLPGEGTTSCPWEYRAPTV